MTIQILIRIFISISIALAYLLFGCLLLRRVMQDGGLKEYHRLRRELRELRGTADDVIVDWPGHDGPVRAATKRRGLEREASMMLGRICIMVMFFALGGFGFLTTLLTI